MQIDDEAAQQREVRQQFPFPPFRRSSLLTDVKLQFYSERDLKSHAMRSKLLSLQLVLQILDSHLPIFVDPSAIIYSSSSDERTPFLQAVKQYLCLCLSRNAVSSVTQVFEISVEIFWRVLCGMRNKLKVTSHSRLSWIIPFCLF